MKVPRIMTLAAVSALLLTACAKQTGESTADGEVYVDLSSITIEAPEDILHITLKDFKYDDKGYSSMNSDAFSFDDNYVYLQKTSGHNRKMDLRSGKVYEMCIIPGCTHEPPRDAMKDPNCLSQSGLLSLLGSTEGLYHVKGSQVFLSDYDTGSETILYTNEFCTDATKKYCEEHSQQGEYPGQYEPMDPYEIYGGLLLHDDVLYIIGFDFFLTYDLQTKQLSEPVVICESDHIFDFAVTDTALYYSNSISEIFRYDLASGDLKKVADHADRPKVFHNQIYYYGGDGTDARGLYTCDENGDNSRLLVPNCMEWVVSGDSIYYSLGNELKTLYLCDLNGENAKELEVPKNSSGISPTLYWITTPSADFVLGLNYDRDVLYLFRTGETQYQEISLKVTST